MEQLSVTPLSMEVPTTSELFQKHFAGSYSVDLGDHRIIGFFEELNKVCLEEDRRNNLIANVITKKHF